MNLRESIFSGIFAVSYPMSFNMLVGWGFLHLPYQNLMASIPYTGACVLASVVIIFVINHFLGKLSRINLGYLMAASSCIFYLYPAPFLTLSNMLPLFHWVFSIFLPIGMAYLFNEKEI